MFILSNYRKKEPLRISKSNNLTVVESSLGNLTFKATESNSPVQFFCIKKSAGDLNAESGDCPRSFKKSGLIPAKLFSLETIYEKPIIEEAVSNTNGYLNLIHDFGDKRSKEAVEKRAQKRFVPNDSTTFNVENQILPSYDKSCKNPKEIYSLQLLFEEQILEAALAVELVSKDCCPFVQSLFPDNSSTDNTDSHVRMVLLEGLHKVLSEKLVSDRSLGKFSFIYKSVKEHMLRNRLPPLIKDKLIAKFLVLSLISGNHTLVLEQIPRFGETLTKITVLLKMLGCSVQKNGIIRLDSLPHDTFTTKKFKRN